MASSHTGHWTSNCHVGPCSLCSTEASGSPWRPFWLWHPVANFKIAFLRTPNTQSRRRAGWSWVFQQLNLGKVQTPVRTTPHTQQTSCKYQVGSGCRPGFRLVKGNLHRPALKERLRLSFNPAADLKGIHGKRALPSNTKDKSIPTSVICPMASFIIRITSRVKSTSLEVRQSWVLTPSLLTSSVILGRLFPLSELSFPICSGGREDYIR